MMPMPLTAKSLPPHPQTTPWQQLGSDLRDRSHAEVYAVPLRSIRATCGLASGETLREAADLEVGDILRLRADAIIVAVAADALGPSNKRVTFGCAHVGRPTLCGHVGKSMLLMSEEGGLLTVELLSNLEVPRGEPILIMDGPMSGSLDYTIIA